MNLKQLSLMFMVFFTLLLIYSDDNIDITNPQIAFKLAKQQEESRNYKNAFEIYEKLLKNQAKLPNAKEAYNRALDCLYQLNRVNEIDAFIEEILEKNKTNPALRIAIAESYLSAPSQGYLANNQFQRSFFMNRGRYVSSEERDRARALQILEGTKNLLGEDTTLKSVYHMAYAQALLTNRSHRSAWLLQDLTDLSVLPEYSQIYLQHQNAPAAKDGSPVVYEIPKSLSEAQNDGQRWRFHLEAAKKNNPKLKNELDYQFAIFLLNQWGVHTLGNEWANQWDHKTTKSIYALETLSDNETLCKLATGIKRFNFPEGFNYIQLFKEIADSKDQSVARLATDQLGSLYANRRQYPKAATIWEKALKAGWDNPHYKERLDQIRGNWGHFEKVQPQVAGESARFQFKFRNASKVSFTAFKIDMPLLLNDIITKHQSKPDLSWYETDIRNIGYALVNGDKGKYATEKFAEWKETLLPRPNHFDDSITFKTPFNESGAYLIQSKVENGNENYIVIFLSDTTIVQKKLKEKYLFYIADSKTGAPLPNMKVEFYGRYNEKVLTQFTLTTNENGLAIPDRALKDSPTWFIIARDNKNRFAYSGFHHYWYRNYNRYEYTRNNSYGITDRPVYKPKQRVNFKFWCNTATSEGTKIKKGDNVSINIRSPQQNVIFQKKLKTDEYGGVSGSFELPEDATLGIYQVEAYTQNSSGSISFRVEEYKKPEFEVTIKASAETVKLGEAIKAKIEAKYYFGAPVTKAKVKYKVLRTEQDFIWHPVRKWDWLYGNGYGWLCYDYPWYPNWEKWGCRPTRHDMQLDFPITQPEVVMENEAEIGEDGTVEIAIETKIFQELYGDKNHKFQMIAEVVDASRRVIVGQGQVIAASRPFKIFAWLDKGYYNEGDNAIANFQTRTINGSPILGKGVVSLYEIVYDQSLTSTEKKIYSEKVKTSPEGMLEYRFNTPKPGQYRIAFELKSTSGDQEEGAVIFTVFGESLEKNNIRFNDLEILTQKSEYKSGELMNFKINTNLKGSTVLLFLRPENSEYQEPEILTIKNKSFGKSILINQSDTPNFFIEALTIKDGKVHVITKEIAVPPEEKILNVEIIPDAKEYSPGQESIMKVKVTDKHKKPFQGALAISVYDKAIEYISGGSNVQSIKDSFWKRKRFHYPKTTTNLDFWISDTYKNNTRPMYDIGYFTYFRDSNKIFKKSMPGIHKLVALKKAEAKDAAPSEEVNMTSELVAPSIRKDFADTAYWNGEIVTDINGLAQIQFKMPENLTTWKINSWAMGANVEVGYNSKEVITTKNVLIRLQAPRFFVEKDEVVLSAIVHNYLKEDQKTKVVFEQFGDCVSDPDNQEIWTTVPSNGEKRIDWRVKVLHAGEVKLRMSALGAKESDSMEMKFPVLVHGIMKMDSFSGVIRPESDLGTVTFKIPEQRKPEASELIINYSPSLAGAMIDALPYLVSYPYGCTEQTLNRFIPTVITQNILFKMGLNLENIQQRKTNLNPKEFYKQEEQSKDGKTWRASLVFDKAEVEKLINVGLKKLYAMQHQDGGWGWFYDSMREYSYDHTTAIVVHGLKIAIQNGVGVDQNNLGRAIDWLVQSQIKKLEQIKKHNLFANNIDALVYKVLAENGKENKEMRRLLMRDKSGLSAYGLCLLGMGLHAAKSEKDLKEVLENIEQYLVQDNESQTAWLNIPSNYWWYWYNDNIEVNALYLTLLSKAAPQSENAARVVKYLLNNRRNATYWHSTRDTALCIEAIAAYWQESGEADPSMTIELWLDGKKKNTVDINKENIFDFENSFRLAGEAVTGGQHTIELRKKGKGTLYYNTYVSYFSKEDFIPKAGLELRTERKIYKLVKDETSQVVSDKRGNIVKQKGDQMKRILINDETMLKSGDLLEVELTVESKNDYEYVCLEDPKAAGFETIEMRSGYNGNALSAYVEYRNEKVVMFAERLLKGKYSVSYKVRAEIPGKFSALPTQVYAMYSPELKGNSNENKIIIVD